jgi:PAS domain S-box-containing protein
MLPIDGRRQTSWRAGIAMTKTTTPSSPVSLKSILAIGVGLSILASVVAGSRFHARNEEITGERFSELTDGAVAQLRRQFRVFESGLRGVRGAIVLAGVDNLSREKFRQYSQARDFVTGFDGSRGFGFIRRIGAEAKVAFTEQARRDGNPNFTIQEAAEHSGERFVIQYTEPEAPNLASIGFDIASEPHRRDTAVKAMESGEAVISAPITLVQVSGKRDRGLLFLLAIYRPGEPIETAADRRTAAIGWAVAPLVIDDVLANSEVFKGEFAFSIRDTTSSASLPFFSTSGMEQDAAGGHLRRISFGMYGRVWEVEARALPPFVKRLHLLNPGVVAAAVLVIGLLLSGFLYAHISNRRRRQEAWLERSRLAAIVDGSDDAIVGTTLTGEITDWNPAAERLFGYEAAEVLGRKLADLVVPPSLVSEQNEALDRVVSSTSGLRLSTQRLTRDGTLMDMVVSFSPIRSESGALVGIGTSARDKTAIVAAQREVLALNESLERQVIERTAELKAITDAIPSLIAYWGVDLRCRFANKAYLKSLGLQPETFIGQSLVSVLGESLFAKNEPYIRAALAGEAQSFERTLTKPDGTVAHAWANYAPHLSESGEVLGFFVVVTDVTPMWDAERRLEMSEARYRLLAENSTDMVFQLDRDLVRRYVSPACREILGYDAEELIGTIPINQIHPEDAPRVRSVYDSLLNGDLEQNSVINRIRHRDGHWIWAEARLRVLKDPETGETSGIFGALRDISIRKAIETELEAAKEAAEAAARIKAEFLASMSHELRTPLNSIIGFSRLILANGEIRGSGIEQHVRIIHGASKMLLSIVNDVLDVSKLEVDQLELDPQPFSPVLLIESTVELLQGDADAKGIEIRTEVAPDVPLNLFGDDARLRQILLNLLSNALKFTTKGSIVVHASRDGGEPGHARLRISVQDSGIGIPEEARPRIFQRFSQVDNTTSRSYGGTGLGLSICKSLVEIMGGTIGFDSLKGQGTTFWFVIELPIVDSELHHGGIEDESFDLAIGPEAQILLAEDNAVNQELAIAILTKWGHHVDVVPNGIAAIEAVQAKRYDIVLMDVQMPLMDGVEATTRIRALGGRYKLLPIVAMTAAVLTNQVEDFKRAGMSDHIGKPFDPRELRRRINHWVTAGASTVADEQAATPATTTVHADGALVEAVRPSVQDGVLDESICSELAEMIGSEKVIDLARRFALDLSARFADVANRKQLCTDAHTVASSSGMMGFTSLSSSARELEYACEGDGDVDRCLCDFLEKRGEVGRFIRQRFGS